MKPLDYSVLSRKITTREKFSSRYGWMIGVGIAITSVFVFMGLLSTVFYREGFFLYLLFSSIAGVVTYLGYTNAGTKERLLQFAAANQLVYLTTVPYDGRAGMIFGIGSNPNFTEQFIAEGRAFAEIGNYQFTTGSGKNRTTHDFGYVRIKLPRRLPNMVLDSRSNNYFGLLSNLNVSFPSDQKLSLEGDFDKYFTLYAPIEYKTDALYVLTPDVMQALITYAKDYDCEIIDDDFYVYSSNIFNLWDIESIKNIVSIANQLQPELAEQTEYYADTNTGNRAANIVMPQGARLKKRVFPLAIIFTILYIIFQFWPAIASLLWPGNN